jgi:hypothetical protein
VAVGSQVVRYWVDEATVVGFEVEPPDGYRDAGAWQAAGKVAGHVRDAVAPAVEAAKVVLEKVKEAEPDEVEVKFGVTAAGQTEWIVARGSAECSFEITLTWRPSDRKDAGAGQADAAS